MSTVKNAANTVEKVVGDSGLNLIINNAGIARRDGLPNVDPELMIELFKVNAVGPLVVVQVRLVDIFPSANIEDNTDCVSFFYNNNNTTIYHVNLPGHFKDV